MNINEISLSIIEPWEFGTEIPINAKIVAKNEDKYLIYLEKSIEIFNEDVQYLLAELRNKNLDKDLLKVKSKKYIMNMAYSKDIDEVNFKNFKFSDFRGSFLIGEIKIK